MVYCVYVNPTIDKTLYFDRLRVGGTNRPERTLTDGAGKAVNAAVVLAELGVETCVTGFVYRQDGDIIRERLDGVGVQYDFLELEGVSRVNTKLFDKNEQAITEINEAGARVAAETLEHVMRTVGKSANEGDVALLTGGLPEGCPAGYYAEMIRAMNKKGVRCVLDASGVALRLGVEEAPYLVKPNLEELAMLRGGEAQGLVEVRAACGWLHEKGIRYVAVSMGKDGSVLSGDGRMVYAKPVRIDVKSTVGAGDSMVAGLIAAMGKPLDEMLRTGAAAASGSCMREGTKLCTADLFQACKRDVLIEEF